MHLRLILQINNLLHYMQNPWGVYMTSIKCPKLLSKRNTFYFIIYGIFQLSNWSLMNFVLIFGNEKNLIRPNLVIRWLKIK